MFSPPAVVINHAGAGDAMRKANNPDRFAKAAPEIKAAAEGYRLVTPQVEYLEKTTLRAGERTFELLGVRKAGKTREQIGMELKMPEYAGWAYQDRMPSNIDAAYRAATSR